MTTPRYHINVFWSEEDECWLADVPDLRFCTTHGDSPEEAIANVEDAVAGWIEAARASGVQIPEPCSRPAIYSAPLAA